MKREERVARLNGLVAFCTNRTRQDTEWIAIYADLEAKEEARVSATQWALDTIAITETLAELERYRVALRKIADALPGGEEICGIPFACWECDEKSKIASDALADEEVKPDETPAI